MSNKSVSFNENGIMTSPLVHDGNLVGIHIDPTKRLNIFITSEVSLILEIPNVRFMRFDEFLEGNSVLDIQAHRDKKEVERLIHKLYYDDLAEGVLEKFLDSVLKETSQIIEVTCSYGTYGIIHAQCKESEIAYSGINGMTLDR